MGFLTVVVSFERRRVSGAAVAEVRLDGDAGVALTAGAFAAPGLDAVPLPGDVAVVVDDVGAGAGQVVGYQDPEPASSELAAPGEVRLYARRGPGVVAVEVWLRADGSLVARNALGSLELGPDGRVTVTTPLGSFGADSHTHPTPFGPSGPPMPGT